MSVQISAYIQDDVKNRLEEYSSNHGMKKGFLIENAISYYLYALNELPSNIIVPSDITISQETYEKIQSLSQIEPTQKLKELLK
jgi:hypothetical protein